MTDVSLVVSAARPFIALTVVGTAISLLYSLWVQRYGDERAAARIASAVKLGALYSSVGLALCLVSLGMPDAVRQFVASVSPFSQASFLVTLVVTAVLLTLAAVSGALWYLPLAVAKVVAVDTVETIEELVGKFLLAVLLLGAVLFWPLGVEVSPTLGLLDYPAALVAAVAVFLLFSMDYYLLSKPRRLPSAAERERLEGAFAPLELEPRRLRVLCMHADEVVDMGYLGLVNPEMVVVPERVLSAVDDERLRVLATALDSLSRTPFVAGRTAVLAGSALAAVWLLSPLAPASSGVRLLLLTGVCLVAVASLWRLRLYVYRADSATADWVGARTLLEQYEWWLEFSGEDRTHGRLRTVLFSQPPLAQRLSRLRAMADEEPPSSLDDPNPAD